MTSRVQAVIFDMDGTLIDARDWHYRALNEALEIFGEHISLDEHSSTFNGLPTKVKLAKLTQDGRIPGHLHGLISDIKQDRTLREIAKNCFPTVEHLLLLAWLKNRNIPMAVATNSIRETAETMLKSAGVFEYLDCVITNEDVNSSKPHPEIYLRACEALGVDPQNALVLEDHEYGVESAKSAGCIVVEVDGPWDVSTKLIEKYFTDNNTESVD
jgi:beta-phosphoglucomutase